MVPKRKAFQYEVTHTSPAKSMLASVFALSMLPVILLMTSEPARACSCGTPPPPCKAVGQSTLVFLGTVVAADAERPFKHARMRIDRKFKGALPSEVELYDDGMCDGPNIEIGRQLLDVHIGAAV